MCWISVGVGFKRLYGCDYVASAISLAHDLCLLSLQRCIEGEVDSDEEIGDSKETNVNGSRITLGLMDITMAVELLPKEMPEELATLRGNDNDDDLVRIELVQHFGRFDIIHDKGTFDVFFMRNDSVLYIESICKHFVKDRSLVCVTSCNATESELVDCFVNHVPLNPILWSHQFKFECVSKLPHRSFVFGGVSGQSVSTVAFRAIAVLP